MARKKKGEVLRSGLEASAEQYGGMAPHILEQLAKLDAEAAQQQQQQKDAVAAATAAGTTAGIVAAETGATATAQGDSGGKTTRAKAKSLTKKPIKALPGGLQKIIQQIKEVSETEDIKQRPASKARGKDVIVEYNQIKEELDEIKGRLSLKPSMKKAFSSIVDFAERVFPGLSPLFDGIRSLANTFKSIKGWWTDRKEIKARKDELEKRLKIILKEQELIKHLDRLNKNLKGGEKATSMEEKFPHLNIGRRTAGGGGGPFSWLEKAKNIGHDSLDMIVLAKWLFGGKGKAAGGAAKMGEQLAFDFGKTAMGGGKLASGFEKLGAAGLKGASFLKGMGKGIGGKLFGPLALAWGVYDGMNRFKQGDMLGGIISMASGIAALFPGVGTAVSVGLDLINFFKDLLLGSKPAGIDRKPTERGQTGTTSPQISTEQQTQTTEKYRKSLTSEQKANVAMVSDVARDIGFSSGQTRGLVSEIGRETAYRNEYMYGTHKDAYNQAINEGIISFQGPRRTAMLDFVKKYQNENKNKNLKIFDEKGNLIPGRDTIKAQMLYLKQEMGQTESGKSFLANKNITKEESEQLLAKVIGWRANDPRFRDPGFAASRAWGSIYDEMTGVAPTPMAPAGPSVAPETSNTGKKVKAAVDQTSQPRSSKEAAKEAAPVIINNHAAAAQPIKPPMPIPSRRAERDAHELLTIAAKIGTLNLLQV